MSSDGDGASTVTGTVSPGAYLQPGATCAEWPTRLHIRDVTNDIVYDHCPTEDGFPIRTDLFEGRLWCFYVTEPMTKVVSACASKGQSGESAAIDMHESNGEGSPRDQSGLEDATSSMNRSKSSQSRLDREADEPRRVLPSDGQDTATVQDDAWNARFSGKKRRSWIIVRGCFKRPLRYADVLSGNVFAQPLHACPVPVVTKTVVAAVRAFNPLYQVQLSPQPELMAPLLGVTQRIGTRLCTVDDDEGDRHADIREGHARIVKDKGDHDDFSVLHVDARPARGSKKRRGVSPSRKKPWSSAWFGCGTRGRISESGQQVGEGEGRGVTQSPVEWTFEFWQHRLALPSHVVNLPLGRTSNVLYYLRQDQHLQIRAKVRDEPHEAMRDVAGQDIWHFELVPVFV